MQDDTPMNGFVVGNSTEIDPIYAQGRSLSQLEILKRKLRGVSLVFPSNVKTAMSPEEDLLALYRRYRYWNSRLTKAQNEPAVMAGYLGLEAPAQHDDPAENLRLALMSATHGPTLAPVLDTPVKTSMDLASSTQLVNSFITPHDDGVLGFMAPPTNTGGTMGGLHRLLMAVSSAGSPGNYKQADHPQDRLAERTSLPANYTHRLRKVLAKTTLPRGDAYARMPDNSFAVFKDAGGRKRLASFLSKHMTPKGKDVTGVVRENLKTASIPEDAVAYSAVPDIDSVMEHGLLSSHALNARPDILEIARPDPEKREAWKKRLASQMRRVHRKGPNVFFTLPDPDKIGPQHYINKDNLKTVEVALGRLMKDQPDTRVYGLELVPHGTEGKRKGYLSHKKLRELLGSDPKELWQHYDDPVGRYYAANVPHGAVVTSDGVIDPKYIKAASDQSLEHLRSKVASRFAKFIRTAPEEELWSAVPRILNTAGPQQFGMPLELSRSLQDLHVSHGLLDREELLTGLRKRFSSENARQRLDATGRQETDLLGANGTPSRIVKDSDSLEFARTVPQKAESEMVRLMHSNDSERIRGIMENGPSLRMDAPAQGAYGKERFGLFAHFKDNPGKTEAQQQQILDRARYYANQSAAKGGGHPATLEFDFPKELLRRSQLNDYEPVIPQSLWRYAKNFSVRSEPWTGSGVMGRSVDKMQHLSGDKIQRMYDMEPGIPDIAKTRPAGIRRMEEDAAEALRNKTSSDQSLGHLRSLLARFKKDADKSGYNYFVVAHGDDPAVGAETSRVHGQPDSVVREHKKLHSDFSKSIGAEHVNWGSKTAGFANESLAQKAHQAVLDEYGLTEADGSKYWKLKTSIYKKMGGTFTGRRDPPKS